MTDRIALRRVTPSDHELLLRIYASTREDELAAVEWDDAQKAAFLAMQFSAQDRHYREHYDGAVFDVITVDDIPAGRLSVARWPAEIRVIDIALLPEYRDLGIASALLTGLLDEAAAAGKSVTMHVERFNPAHSLYERLGFSTIEARGAHLFLEWRPPQVNTAS